MISILTVPQTRWTSQYERATEAKKNLLGDIAQATAFIAYCGPFGEELRRKLLDTFRQACVSRCVPFTPYSAAAIAQAPFPPHVGALVEEPTVLDWRLQGLPGDQHSIESALVVMRSTRWPLLVDPQQLGVAWLSKALASSNVIVTAPAEKQFALQLETAVVSGRPLIIQNLQEIPPIMNAVLRKSLTATRAGLRIGLGDHDVSYAQEFRLYMATRVPMSALSPVLTAHAVVVDFTVSTEALEANLLIRVIGNEKPEQERERRHLLTDIAAHKHEIQDLERRLLSLLTERSQTSLVDDAELIDTLALTKSQDQEGIVIIA